MTSATAQAGAGSRGRALGGDPGGRGDPRRRRRTGRIRHQEGRAGLGRPGPGAGHPVRRPLPHLPRQHGRQRGAGQHPERPARGRHLAAVGGQRLRAHVRQLHAGGGDAGRHPRTQAHHARRRRHLLRRLGGGRPGHNVDWLIAGRVIMGVGAAASEPGTLSIIRHVYPDRETRADALGVWAAVSGLALALGPVIGGALVGFSSWRAIFWFNLGFGVVAFVLAAVAVPETSDRQGRSIDFAGFLFGAAFLACMSFAVIQGEESGYTSPWIVALFVLSGAVRRGVRHRRAQGQEPDARPHDVPPAAVRRFQLRGLRRLLRHLLHLLLHRAVPAGRRQRVGLPDSRRLPSHGGRPDHRVRARPGRWWRGSVRAGR